MAKKKPLRRAPTGVDAGTRLITDYTSERLRIVFNLLGGTNILKKSIHKVCAYIFCNTRPIAIPYANSLFFSGITHA